jgi:hypothetical protein
MALLGALALSLTMLSSGAGAAADHVPIPAARLLPHRSCVGLLSAADFPGTASTGQLHLHGLDVCTFSGGTRTDPTGADVSLKVFASTGAAHAFFLASTGPLPADLGSHEYTKLRGYGNEAVYGTVCSAPSASAMVCGLSVTARVTNDVFSISEFGITAPLTRLTGKVVSELCPSCKF